MRIRYLREDETEILKDFLYDAIFIPEGIKAPDRSVIELPELRVYYEDFGSGPADCCMAAEEEGNIIGAVWSRIMPDYGHVDDETPSLAISVRKEYRGRGIGTSLLKEMLAVLKKRGYPKVSLSVQKANPAVRLYRRCGFQTVAETAEEYIMIRDLLPGMK
ncbi:MAG: GNAT family N-acetyltransferase [Solobacterium sp.]|nr:GNAT family N-acetyltransferase [Solobacterium sp.]